MKRAFLHSEESDTLEEAVKSEFGDDAILTIAMGHIDAFENGKRVEYSIEKLRKMGVDMDGLNVYLVEKLTD